MDNKMRSRTIGPSFFLPLCIGLALILSPLGLSKAQADNAAAESIGSPDPPSATSQATYDNEHHVGVGLAWAPMDMVQQNGSDVFANVGFVDARYWFNDRFGLDGGLGFGFPQVSPNSSFMATLNIEPMLALITRKHSIFYANIDLMPALNTGASLPSAVTLSGGFGFESEVADISKLAWFAQWNPLSLNWNMPNHGDTATGFTFFGSIMNVMLGFHYYF